VEVIGDPQCLEPGLLRHFRLLDQARRVEQAAGPGYG
jgi:hypothetical protein